MRSAEDRVAPKVITVTVREPAAAAALRAWDPAAAVDLEVAVVVADAVDSFRILAVREISRTTV